MGITKWLVLWVEHPSGDKDPVASFADSNDLEAVQRYLQAVNPQSKYWRRDLLHIGSDSVEASNDL